MVMIDIHSHIWQRHHWSDKAIAEIEACYGKTNKWHCPPEEHWETGSAEGGSRGGFCDGDECHGGGGSERVRP